MFVTMLAGNCVWCYILNLLKMSYSVICMNNVRTHCTNAWWNRCKTDLNSFPRRKLDETTGTSSYYMDENHSAGSEIQRPQYGRCSWPGSEPSTLEIDVYVQRYALLVVLARNDDDDSKIVISILILTKRIFIKLQQFAVKAFCLPSPAQRCTCEI